MSAGSKLRFMLTYLWRRGRVERELDDELAFHIEMETAENIRRGMTPEAARRAALVAFGGKDRFTEAARDTRGFALLGDVMRDVRVAMRMLARTPQFTFVAVLTLAIGIGANTAIFSVVNAVLLRDSPFIDPDRLVMVWQTDRASGTSHEPSSWPDIVDVRERSRSFEEIGALVASAGTLTGNGEPERLSMLSVTPNLPRLLGVQPIIGRMFEADEGQQNGPRVALLAEEYWRRRFDADRAIVGETLLINDRPVTIVGVLPAEADLGVAQIHANADYSAPLAGPNVDVWFASEPRAESFPRSTHPFLTIGRLRPGVELEAAQRELSTIMTELEQTYPENAARGVHIESYDAVTFGAVRPVLVVLLGAVALVLLIACVNVANLLLARTTVRAREVAVRRALGASTGSVVRQFVVEGLVLTTLGAAAGVALAVAGQRLLIAAAPADIPRLAYTTLDLRVLAFTTAITIGVALAFGLTPALVARRVDLQTVLKSQTGRGGTAGGDARRFRNALVVAEIALAVALVIGSGVLLRSFWSLAGVDPGFNSAGVLKLEYQLPASRYPVDYSKWPNLVEINRFSRELEQRVAALPGVTATALTTSHPLNPGFTNSFTVVGREAEARDWPEIRTRFVTPGYLETMQVSLLSGRAISTGDDATGTRVAMINRAAATRYFNDRNPIGQQLQFWGVAWQVVGVIGDERFNGLANAAEPAVYTPLAQAPSASGVLLVRTVGDPRSIVQPVRSVFQQLDPQLAIYGVEPLSETVSASIGKPRFIALILVLFGSVAIVLALVGVHGVLSYTVAQRAPEVGIRMALGASRGGVIGLVVRDGMRLAALGVGLGVLGALVGSSMLRGLVYGVGPRDPWTFVVVVSGALLLTGIASWLPARRAASGAPMVALRSD